MTGESMGRRTTIDSVNWNRLIVTCLVLWALLAAAFAFLDLPISVAVVNRDSTWGRWLARWGEQPGLISGTIAFALVVVMGLVGLIRLVPRFAQNNALLLPRSIRAYAWTTFAMLALNRFLFVPLGKLYWGRVRFKDLDPTHADFTPWYVVNGVTGHFSFPSGHSAAGWLLLPLVFLAMRAPKFVQIAVLMASATWGIAVSLSRVRVGAHYASDVLFSTGVSVVIFLLCFRHFYPRGLGAPGRSAAN